MTTRKYKINDRVVDTNIPELTGVVIDFEGCDTEGTQKGVCRYRVKQDNGMTKSWSDWRMKKAPKETKAKFKVGDEVCYKGSPNYCGTVQEVKGWDAFHGTRLYLVHRPGTPNSPRGMHTHFMENTMQLVHRPKRGEARKELPAYDDGSRYKIVRFFEPSSGRSKRVITRGLTLSQAQAYCQDPRTSSRTATDAKSLAYTRKNGAWFDGYEKE